MYIMAMQQHKLPHYSMKNKMKRELFDSFTAAKWHFIGYYSLKPENIFADNAMQYLVGVFAAEGTGKIELYNRRVVERRGTEVILNELAARKKTKSNP